MKIALLCDSHFGARLDNPVLLDYQEKFFEDVFFPEIERQQVDAVIHLGDVFDRRKQINLNTLDRARKMYFDPLYESGVIVFKLVGNHDTYYKETNGVNALTLCLKEYDFQIFEDPYEMELGGLKMLLLPWITPENYEKSVHAINNSSADYVFGHLEINGFPQSKGNLCDHGFDPKIFKKFEYVFSGHFHLKNLNGNIAYLGTPYEMTWEDSGSPKGFHILDTETLDLEFIENHEKLFKTIRYDATKAPTLPPNLENCYVKVVVDNIESPKAFDDFMKKVEASCPVDFQIINQEINSSLSAINNVEVKGNDELFKEYVDSLENLPVKKEDVVDELMSILKEASMVT